MGDLVPQPPTEAALLVVTDDPLYARVHRVCRPFLSPRFRLDGTGPGAAVRPSFHLYEVWCFFATQRQLAAALPDWSWSLRGAKNLLALRGTGAGAVWSAEGPTGSLRLLFNPTFASYFQREGRDRWSLSGERRPDLVVTFSGEDGVRSWLCLDAKYRAGRKNLGDALSSAHIYRDSLRYEGYGGSCRAAVLLAPARAAEAGEWFGAEFRRRHGMGIEALTPGRADESQLGRWLVDLLQCSVR